MRAMKGVRALASGMLVLGAVCVVPAVSAAQDTSTTTDTPTTVAEPAVPRPSPPDASSVAPGAPPEGVAAGTSPEAAEPISESTDDVRRVEPADAPSGGAPAASLPTAQKAASASVTMGDFFFAPGSVTVAVGDTVTWSNTGQAPHNATANDASFKTPDLNNGESASHQFTAAGTFGYICTIHPNMKGTVRVLSAAGTGGGGGGGGDSAGSTGSGQSEAAAVASPSAAGDSNTLPLTGMASGALALVGLALLGSGLIVRRASDRAPGGARRFLTLH
jgi:plastocyanin